MKALSRTRRRGGRVGIDPRLSPLLRGEFRPLIPRGARQAVKIGSYENR
jgi:hypothetical protein